MPKKEAEEKPKEKEKEEPAPAEEGASEEDSAEENPEEEPSEDSGEPEEEADVDDDSEEPPAEEGKKGPAVEKKEKAKDQKQGKAGPRTIVRIGSKDLDGNIKVSNGLKYVPGVSFMYGNAVSKVSGLGDKMVRELSEDELKKIEDIIANPSKYGIVKWLYNRRFDPEDGEDKHIISAQLELKKKMDINELKKRKCYRGVRHIIGLPVRGQRTRSSFRRAATVGVSRVKAKPAAKPKPSGKPSGKK